jgi:hypothetical protein
MTKFFIKWEIDHIKIPDDPEKRAKLWFSLLGMVKNDLESNVLKDWGQCSDASCGYAFSELSEKDLYIALLKYIPYIIFDVKPSLTVYQCIDSLEKAVAPMKK